MKMNKKIVNDFSKVLKQELIFDLAGKVAKKIPGSEIYVVGGAVRDVILGRPIKDIDILVRKVKIVDLEKFLKSYGKVDLVGKRFSVLKFLPRGGRQQLDISIPRLDFSFGTGGYKDVKVKSDPDLPIEEDLARRDFTINAMAWNVVTNELVDPYGGLKDLKLKIIRTVGSPKERFAEDYSRLLRAIRFAIQLGFKIEEKTWSAVKKHIGHINDLAESGERKVPFEIISSEFLKAFNANPVETVKIYFECGAMAKLMPEIVKMKGCAQPKKYHSEGDVLTHTLLALQNLESKTFKKYFAAPPDLSTKTAVFLHDIAKPTTKRKMEGRVVFYNHDKEGAKIARRLLDRMKMSAPPELGVDIDKIFWMIEHHLVFFYSQPNEMKKTTLEKYFFGPAGRGESLLQLFLVDALATKPEKEKLDLSRFKMAYQLWNEMKENKKEVPPKPFLNGDEVMKILKLAPGPKVGEVLESLREEQLNGRIKSKKEAEFFLKKTLTL